MQTIICISMVTPFPNRERHEVCFDVNLFELSQESVGQSSLLYNLSLCLESDMNLLSLKNISHQHELRQIQRFHYPFRSCSIYSFTPINKNSVCSYVLKQNTHS